MTLENLADAAIDQAVASIECPRGTWRIDLGKVPAREAITVEQRLPRHDTCEGYQVDLLEATW